MPQAEVNRAMTALLLNPCAPAAAFGRILRRSYSYGRGIVAVDNLDRSTPLFGWASCVWRAGGFGRSSVLGEAAVCGGWLVLAGGAG